jgi:hypothetical protein
LDYGFSTSVKPATDGFDPLLPGRLRYRELTVVMVRLDRTAITTASTWL